MGSFPYFLVIFPLFLSSVVCQVEEFVSLDCGGTSNYTDRSTGLPWTSDMGFMSRGKSAVVENPRGNLVQYQRRREFPIDGKKYCYTLITQERRRYLVRATFQYGSRENKGTYPQFRLYMDATKWSTVSISDASRIYVKEAVIRAPSDSINVCICCATTGSPFISTLELRPFSLSMYATDFEDNFFLAVAARLNVGAPSEDPLRYPDDPYDRIWESDLVKRQNFLVDVAPGTQRISTSKNVNIRTREYPPEKLMQTAVVGTRGKLSYRLNLDDFPGNARAYAYFAEIEDLGANETQKFINVVVNIAENANGSYTLYEPSFMNVSFDFDLSFAFVKTGDSTRGPLLNAMEIISKYVKIDSKTDGQDLIVVNALRSMSSESISTNEDDPCVPTQWEWVNCSLTPPPRITKINASRKNVKGEIPLELNNMEALTERLDGNSLTGPLPEISNLINLKILHLENNELSGPLPYSLGSLPNLQEVYIQNNSFTGEIPRGLLSGRVNFHYGDNPKLHKGAQNKKHFKLILGISIGCNSMYQKESDAKGDSKCKNTKPSAINSIARGAHSMDDGITYYIALSELEEATQNFSKKIGRGSFGSVFYGKMKDGKEVAVKIMTDLTSHGNQQFVTEVALLSRIHHRNLVPLIGYCEEEHQCILVYEYIHNGTLQDRIHDSAKQNRLDWLARLYIAEDAAKGLEYLHTGCNPRIIHRDVKTSNILLDINMRAKVSDFGLSRQAEEDLSHISSVARGTVGYLDPVYFANQQFTEKSDVYSFGKAYFPEEFGPELNIVHWARSSIRKGDIISVIDPFLVGNVKIESVWRIAEVAIQCVEQHRVSRPRMQEIIWAIQDAIKIEKGTEGNQKNVSPGNSMAQTSRKTLLRSYLEIESSDLSKDCLVPSA
ncbi:hypothetical protein I3760_15G049300 [Carya illinoinensis]|nr:hypothetical protein I3760_15G049300 [Carya illinoinensis]